MGCCNIDGRLVGIRNQDTSRSNITIDYAGDDELRQGDKCPIEGSALDFARRPKPHWRCKANNHRWRIA